MANNSSLYGSGGSNAGVSSSNFTTLYSGGGGQVPGGDNVIITGTLTVNGCSILTDCSAFNLLPFNAETLNIGLESTALSLGATIGFTLIRNQLSTANYVFPVADGTANQVLITDGAGNLSFADVQSLDTNYTIDASVATGGANFNLQGSDGTTDTIKFAQGAGVSVVRTDANTITITNTDPGSVNVTSITGTANQVIASSPTGAVTLSLPQDIATTSNPTFSGVIAGIVNIGVSPVPNNVITTTTGSNADLVLYANGTGEIYLNDTTNIGQSGITGAFKYNGFTSGSTTITAPATGSNINWVLPNAQGALNTVLTNDGSGNLYWQLATPVTYNIDASVATGGANFNLTGSDASLDTIKFAEGSGMSVVRTDANTITFANTSPGTTYTQNASATTGGANLNLVGSDATTDTVKFASGTNITVSRTDADTITITVTGTNTTYTQNASATTGGANLNLVGSDATTDTVKFANGTGISVVRTDADTITITNTAPEDAYTIDATATTGGANLNLTNSAATDSVKFGGSGATTVTRTSADIITISSTDTNTTYTQNASATTGGANLNLVGSDATTDAVKFASGTGITVTRTDADTITITNADPGSAGVTSITGTANQVIASASTGAVTLSTPQDIATTSSVAFGGLNVDSGTLFVDPTNNRVGINTIAPIQELTVNAGGDGLCQIGMENTERTWLVTNNDGDDLISYSVVIPSPFSVTNRFQIDATGGNQWFNTGNLGVNTNAPAYTLDVNGDIKVGGDTIYNSFNEKLIDYTQFASIYGTSRQANFQATNNIGVRASFFAIDGNVEFNTNSLTTSATTPDQVLSFWDQTTVEAIKSTIRVMSGGAVQCIEVLMVQDGTNISLNTYGDVRTAGNLTTVSSGFNAITGYWELRVTPVNAVTSYKVTNQIMY